MGATSTPAKAGMTKTERQGLIKIVRGRFRVMGKQLDFRVHEVETIVRDRLREEFAAAIEEADAATAELKIRLAEIESDAAKLEVRMKRRGISPGGYNQSLFRVDWHDPWRPAGESQVVHDEMARVGSEAFAAKIRLEAEEVGLVEELLVGELDTVDAQTFLAGIPTIETLLPIPEPRRKKAKAIPARAS